MIHFSLVRPSDAPRDSGDKTFYISKYPLFSKTVTFYLVFPGDDDNSEALTPREQGKKGKCKVEILFHVRPFRKPIKTKKIATEN